MNTDPIRRAARTFLQAFIGTLALLAIPALSDLVRSISSSEPYQINFAFWQGVVIAACLSGLIALISFAQNAFEDKTGVEIIGKTASNTDLGERVRRV